MGTNDSGMPEAHVEFVVRFEKEGAAASGGSTLRFRLDPKHANESNGAPDGLTIAAAWALDLDAQYRDLLLAGHRPRVVVPEPRRTTVGRVQGETLADYRNLQLSVGELIRPLLLAPPTLDDLYPFQRQGVEWLVGRRSGILADDMGLGKTVEVIAALRVLFNQWWNPSANDQARDRVVRIGQRRAVRVYRFCCRGTIEEALERILASKKDLFAETVERLAQDEKSAWTRILREVGMNALLPEGEDAI